MASPRDLLQQVWTQFRRAGIADDLSIIEHVAAILTENMIPPYENLRPRMPLPGLVDVQGVKTLLHQASESEDVGGKATLFDRYVLFRLPTMLPGGRYPTPRHIVRMMHHLAQVQLQHTLADFACGSGGFLVYRSEGAENAPLGCEISLEWARLAWANCALHGMSDARIETGNSLFVSTGKGMLAGKSFDRILMNPPFGEAVDAKLARNVLGQGAGSRSETVLATLALNKLADEGVACILVPSGLLFSAGGAELGLRKRLVEECQLEAVISLPKDAFQPFSPLQTHLIKAQNSPSSSDTHTWFLLAEYDGYPSGRSRDLTQPPGPESDLPLIEAVIDSTSKSWSETYPARQPLIGIKRLEIENQQNLGVVIGATGEAVLTRAERFLAPETALVLVSAIGRETGESVWICVEAATGRCEIVEDRNEYLVERLKLKKRDEPVPNVVLLQEKEGAASIPISSDGRLMGMYVHRARIRSTGYDLRPDRYVRQVEERRETVPPAKLLADIRKNQHQLLERIDGLLSRLDMPPIAGEEIPPRVWQERGMALQPFGALSKEQETVWQRVCEKVEMWEKGEEKYPTPVPFAPEEIEEQEGSDPSPGTQTTLDILERMGLIVPITITSPEGEETAMRYRLVSERDRWKDEPGEADEGTGEP